MSSKYGRTPGETSPRGNGSFSGTGDLIRGEFSEEGAIALKSMSVERNEVLEKETVKQPEREQCCLVHGLFRGFIYE